MRAEARRALAAHSVDSAHPQIGHTPPAMQRWNVEVLLGLAQMPFRTGTR